MAGLSFHGLQQSIPSPVASDVGPSLVTYDPDGVLYAAWKGSNGDQRIWVSKFGGTSWTQQQSLPDPIATAHRPALAVLPSGTARRLYAAWRGSDDDERIWFTFFEDITGWLGQNPMQSPIASSVGPSLAVFNNTLYAAWKGSGSDERLWWSTYNISTGDWAPQTQFPSPIASSVGPSLAVFGQTLFAAWKGSGNDEGLYYSLMDADTGGAWSNQTQMPSPIASSVGPSLVEYNGLFYAVWKGSGSDERIWYTAYGENGFGFIAWGASINQEPLPNPIASSVGPSGAQFQETLYLAWKGSDSDTRIWWTSATTNG
jgi:hypothetical protein